MSNIEKFPEISVQLATALKGGSLGPWFHAMLVTAPLHEPDQTACAVVSSS